uniref:Uncharacterized protein n=1 Tax=Avena sativa TaxID=4498 RepID=A0ACD5Z1I3_AVESA
MDKGMQEALVKSLSVLKKLQVLQVWFDDNEKVCLPSWEYSVSYLKLRQLLLFGVIVPSQMSWIHNLYVPELTKLLLEAEVLKAQDLEILGEMSSLRSLYLHSKEYRRLSYTTSKEEFKVLEYLNTNIELVCGDGALPMIKELEVSGIKVGTDVGLKGNMPLLERASYHLDCNGCILVQIDKAEAALRQASEAHPNHPTLYIKRYGNYNVPLELLHQIKQSADQEFFAGGSLGLGEGGQGQASASNATSNFFKNMTELLTPFIRIPPTLTLDGATDGMASTSQVKKVIWVGPH